MLQSSPSTEPPPCVWRGLGDYFELLELETHQGLGGTRSAISWENGTPADTRPHRESGQRTMSGSGSW